MPARPSAKEYCECMYEIGYLIGYSIPRICKNWCGKEEEAHGRYCTRFNLIFIDTAHIWKDKVEEFKKNFKECPKCGGSMRLQGDFWKCTSMRLSAEDLFIGCVLEVISHEFIHRLTESEGGCPDEILKTLEGCA